MRMNDHPLIYTHVFIYKKRNFLLFCIDGSFVFKLLEISFDLKYGNFRLLTFVD